MIRRPSYVLDYDLSLRIRRCREWFDQSDILATESEAIAKNVPESNFTGLIRNVIEVADGVRVLIVDSWRDFVIWDGAGQGSRRITKTVEWVSSWSCAASCVAACSEATRPTRTR